MPSQQDWWNIFCPRDQDLRVLQDAYERVSKESAQHPELVVLLADSGLGKTRLAQEFFAWLSTHKDGVGGAGYWPDTLARENNNLVINPPPEGCVSTHPMPFLWWGIRLSDPGRRNTPVSVPAVAAFVDRLEPHLEPFHRARRLRELRAKSGEVAAKGIMDASFEAIPFAGLVKTGVETLFELVSIRQKGKQESERVHDRGEIQNEQRRSLIDALLRDLSILLAPRSGAQSALPAVILIDDAQFASSDPGLLEFASRLFVRALEDDWPVLIVVTHWEAEWQKAHSSNDSFRSVVDRCWRPTRVDWKPHVLAKVEDLSPVVKAALPGLLNEQVGAVLERADGNPRLLDEILRWLQRSPRHFVERDITRALSEDGLKTTRSQQLDLHALVEERLKASPPEVQAALAVSSVQGTRFLDLLTEDVCRALDLGNARQGIELGIDPHRFATRVRGAAVEFAQRVYFEVASDVLPDLEDARSVRAALAAAVKARMKDQSGRGESAAEREVLLAVAGDLFETDELAENRLVGARALCELAERLQARRDFQSAFAAASRVEKGRESGAWEIADFELRDIDSVVNVLTAMTRPSIADLWASAMLDGARRVEQSTSSPKSRRYVSIAIRKVAHVAEMQGRLDEANKAYRESLEIRRLLAKELGTPKSHRDVSLSLEDVAYIAEIQGQLDEADKAYRESLEIRRLLVKELGTPQSRRDVSVALSKVAGIARMHGRLGEADKAYRESLEIGRLLAKEQGTPQSRRDVSVFLSRVADIAEMQGRLDEAEKANRESLEICRLLVKELGTPQSRRDVSVALDSVARIAEKQGRLDEANKASRESLEIRRLLAKELGTPQSRRGVSVSLGMLGRIAEMQGQLDEADKAYRESLEIGRLLMKELGTPQSRRDVSVSLSRVAGIARMHGRLGEADKAYRESLEIGQLLAKEQGTPQSRRDVSAWLSNVAGIAYVQGRFDEADKAYREGLEMGRLLVNELGTPVDRFNISVFLNNVGLIAEMQGRLEEANQAYRESLEICRLLVKELGTPAARRSVSVSLNNVADIAAMQGRLDEADNAYCESLEICRSLVKDLRTPQSRRDVSVSLDNVARRKMQKGMRVEACNLWREALTFALEIEGEESRALVEWIERRIRENCGELGDRGIGDQIG